MKKSLTLPFVFVIAFITSSQAEIRQETRFNEVVSELANADQDTLVVFDVDDVIDNARS
jgi:hypothetical protein